MRSQQGRWTRGDRDDFAAPIRVLFLVSYGGSRDRVRQGLHWLVQNASEIVLRPLEETVHGRRPGEVLRFDSLYVRESSPLGKDGLNEEISIS